MTEVIKYKFPAELNIYTVQTLWTELSALVESSAYIEGDLSDVESIDAAGIQLLAALKLAARRKNCRLRLVNHSDESIRNIGLFGLISKFGDKVRVNSEDRKAWGLTYQLNKRELV